MRLALISDIHANYVALEAVLTSLATQQITHIICLGDVASTGPQPREVITRLQEIGCSVVMGNMDAWLLQPHIKQETILLKQNWQDIDLWCAQQLSSADRAYLQSFPPVITCPLENGKVLFCYHGSPRSYNERILPTTSEEELDQAFAGVQADILVGGHTHIQLFRRYKAMLILNPGSVGLAMDRVTPIDAIRQPAWAEYALLDFDGTSFHVELHRIAFDLQAFFQSMERSGMPHATWWAIHWKEADAW